MRERQAASRPITSTGIAAIGGPWLDTARRCFPRMLSPLTRERWSPRKPDKPAFPRHSDCARGLARGISGLQHEFEVVRLVLSCMYPLHATPWRRRPKAPSPFFVRNVRARENGVRFA